MKTTALVARLVCSIVLINICSLTQKAFAVDGHWVTTWATGPQLTEPANLPPAPGLASNTLRQVVHITLGGKQVRVRFCNSYGTNAVMMNSVHVALSTGTNTIDVTTDKALTFHGQPSVIVPRGELVLSDPFDYNLPAQSNLAITIYYGAVSANTISGHPGSRSTSTLVAGNSVSAATLPLQINTKHWYTITGVDVLADSTGAAVVTLGDSITDGRGSTDDHNDRWGDNLGRRLLTNAPTANVSVPNMGIGGGAVVSGGLGPTALNRFDRDVLHQSGVKWLIIFEGVNDIGGASSQVVATNLINAYTLFANKAHANNIRVYGATITPFGAYTNNPAPSGYFTVGHEQSRQTVNAWIRTNTLYDGVLDFDMAVRDQVTLTNINPQYYFGVNANDGLHMNPLGYQAIANSIDLSLFVP